MMSRKVNQLRKQNNQLEEKLSQDNQNVLTDIIVYLRTSQISDYQQEIIRNDITQMMIDGEQRNMDMHDVIGNDYKEFCDNILAEVPKQSITEKILSMIAPICLYCWIVLVIWLVTCILEIIFDQNTLPLLVLKLGDFVSYGTLIFVSIFIVDYICKNSFEINKTKYKFVFMLIVWMIVFSISRLLLNDFVFYIHIYIAIGLFMFLLIGYKVFDELFN
jgi:DNA-binding ferritin-like protein (Dps family)